MLCDPELDTGSSIQLKKYNPAGVLQWEKDFDAAVDEYVNPGDIAIDSSDNIYVSGTHYKASDDDFLLLKYNTAGDLQWSETFDLNGDDQGWPFMTLDIAGNIYLAGESYSSSTRDDYLLVKYSPEGTLMWQQTYNGPKNQWDGIAAITVGSDLSVYVTGVSDYRYVMNRIEDGVCRTQKYSRNGDLVWSIDHAGPRGDMEYPASIAVSDNGQVYITGSFEGSIMYGSSRVICYTECSSNGDCNADYEINMADFAVLAGQWLDGNCGECEKADLTGDENVQVDDLLVIANNWLWDINADLEWDFNDDGIVNLIDLAVMAQAWQSQPGQAQWDKDCDLSQTKGVIDIEDLKILSEHWLEDIR
jgi:hypothetical protein